MKKMHALIQERKVKGERMPETQDELYEQLQNWESKRKLSWEEQIKKKILERKYIRKRMRKAKK